MDNFMSLHVGISLNKVAEFFHNRPFTKAWIINNKPRNISQADKNLRDSIEKVTLAFKYFKDELVNLKKVMVLSGLALFCVFVGNHNIGNPKITFSCGLATLGFMLPAFVISLEPYYKYITNQKL